MAISYVGAGTVATGITPTVSVPAGYAAGDLLLMVGTSVGVFGNPSGWALLTLSGTPSNNLTVWFRIAGQSEGNTILTNGSSSTKAVILAYRGASNIAAVSSFTTASATSLATSTSASTAAANDFVLSLFVGANTASVWTAPGSTTTRVTSDSTAAVNGLLIVDETQASVGATTARTASVSVSNTLSALQFVLTTATIPNNITFVSSGTVVTGANPAVPLPSSYAVGDLLLLLVSSTVTPSTPTGWTLIVSSTTYGAFYKTATSSETSVTVTTSGTSTKAVMLAYANAIYAKPATIAVTATSTTPNTFSASNTTFYPGSTTVLFFGDSLSATPSTWGSPSGTTARVDSPNTAALRGILVCDFNAQMKYTSTGRTGVITNSTAWSGVPIELKQANAFYIDPDNGNDNSVGTLFSSAVKNISGYLETTTGSVTPKGVYQGDTMRIKESPLYNTGIDATWTSVTERGISPFSAISITAATNATPIVCSCANHGYSTGDVIQIAGATGNTAANGVWKVTVINANSFSLDDSSGNGSYSSGGTVNPIFCRTIKTASALVKPIASFAPLKTVSLGTRAAWVGANANITPTLTATFGKGAYYDTITIAVGATTGKMAYYALPSTLDLSSYQQLSLFIVQSSGTTIGGLTIALCSDTIGDTIVNSFAIPSTNVTGVWTAFNFDNGSALGASIRSIAIYRNTVTGVAQTFLLNSIVACKSPSSVDALSNTSLITKNNGTESAYAVGGFGGSDGTIVFLDSNAGVSNSTATAGAYYGITETVPLYRIAPFNPYTLNGAAVPSGTTTSTFTSQAITTGTSSYPVTYSGGWSSADMSTRTGQTWFLNGNGYGTGVNITAGNTTFDGVNIARAYYGYTCSTSSLLNIVIKNLSATSLAQYGIYMSSNFQNLTLVDSSITNSPTGVYLINSGAYAYNIPSTINNCVISGCASGVSNYSTSVYINVTNCNFNTSSTTPFINTNSTTAPYYGSYANNNHNYFNTTAITTTTSMIGNLSNNTFVPEPAGGSYLMSGSAAVPQLPQNIYTTWYNTTVNPPTTAYSQGSTTMTAISSLAQNHKFINCSFGASNVTYSFINTVNENGGVYFYNCTGLASAVTLSGNPFLVNAATYSQDEGGTVGNNKIYFSGGLATSQTAVRHTPSGYAWSMAPTSTTNTTSTYPMELKIASIAANGGSAVTITAWMRRTNTGLTMQLVCPGGQPYGPTSDTTASMTAAADTWEQLSISFTPTQNAVFDIYAYAYGGTTYTGYVDDLGVSQ